MDTLVLAWDIRRIAQDGTVGWHRHFELDTLYSTYFNGIQQIHVVENAAAEIFVVFAADFEWQNLTSVHKLTANGDLLWSRRIGDASAMMSFPSPSSLFLNTVHLAPDLSGGCRLVAPAAENNDESTYVLSLAPDGSLEWARLYDYLGLVMSFWMTAPAVTADGTTLFFTSTDSDNGGVHLVRISDGGDLLDVQQYQAGGYIGDLQNDQNVLLMFNNNRLITMSETGDLLSAIGFTSLPDASDSTYNLQFNHLTVAGGRACFAGSFIATPTGAGLPLASAAISSFDLNNASCGRVVFTPEAEHVTLPNSIFTCGPMSTMASDTLSLAVSDAPSEAEARPLFGTTDLCVYTSIHPEPSSVSVFTVSPTVLPAGDPLTITSDRPLRYSIVDVKGALVWNDARANQRLDIPTAEMTPGLYMLMGRDVTGQVVGTAKVMIER